MIYTWKCFWLLHMLMAASRDVYHSVYTGKPHLDKKLPIPK